MKKMLLAAIFALASAGLAMGQNYSSPVDVLGAHNNNGRGCAGCHQPHSGAFGSGQKGAADSGSYALWGQDASPLYGASIAFGDGGSFVEVLPTGIATGSQEVGGILLCLSCHDGNVTPKNMMANQSYEQKIGLLTNTAYGGQPIPTLLGNDGTVAGNYTNDHPVGQQATVRTGNGLVNTAGVLSTLLERQLVKIVGRKQVVGRPFMYATTREFLIRFGLRDLNDLPKIEEMAEALGFEVPAGLSQPSAMGPVDPVPRQPQLDLDGSGLPVEEPEEIDPMSPVVPPGEKIH